MIIAETPFEVLAYRAWAVDNEGCLVSPIMAYRWEENQADARCLMFRPGEHAPEEFGKHGCGIYATKSKELALGYAYGVLANVPNMNIVLGSVLLSGLIVEGEHGYRATKAKVGEICASIKEQGSNLVLVEPPSSLNAPVGSFSDWEGVRPEFF